MKKVEEWRQELRTHKYLILMSIFFLVFALILNYFAGNYVNKAGSAAVTDLILDHLPSVDLSFLFIYSGSFAVVLLLLYPLIFDVKKPMLLSASSACSSLSGAFSYP